jgi:2-polyprenyl-3-methyl-5-hydroxy-6-metoxy-1,4-benzoquinol methylase
MDIKELKNRKEDAPYRHPWELARIEVIFKELKKIIKLTDSIEDISIIDIGCGDLFVLESINEAFKFKELLGVDNAINQDIIEKYEENCTNKKIRLFNDLNQIQISKNNISIILLLDVIEHINNDKLFLDNLLKCAFVNEKTIFFITVPSYQSLFCSHDVFLAHYRRYSNTQLVALLRATNYYIISKGYFFSILLIPRLMTVLKEKFFTKKDSNTVDGTDLTNWNQKKLISLGLKYALLVDYFITMNLLKIKVRLPGLSNFVICKKSV